MQALMRYQLEKTMNSWSRKEFLSPGGWRTRVIRNEKAAYEFKLHTSLTRAERRL